MMSLGSLIRFFYLFLYFQFFIVSLVQNNFYIFILRKLKLILSKVEENCTRPFLKIVPITFFSHTQIFLKFQSQILKTKTIFS